MRNRFATLSLVGILLLCVTAIQAQEQPHDVIRLVDGTALEGRLMSFDGEVFRFHVAGENREFPRATVSSIELNRTHSGSQNQHISIGKTVFSADEEIELRWHGLPGNRGDWIAVVPAGSPDTTWGKWWYASGEQSGVRNIGKLSAGTYEVRVYFDWPKGGYAVQSRLPFTVQ